MARNTFLMSDVLQLCPLNRRVDAVYVELGKDGEVKDVWREPVLFGAIYVEREHSNLTGRLIPGQDELGHSVALLEGHPTEGIDTDDIGKFGGGGKQFLGYEFDRHERDWTEGIDEYRAEKSVKK